MRITRRQLRQMIAECMSDEMGMEPMDDMVMIGAGGEHKGRMLGDGGTASMARGQLFTTAQKAQSLYDRLADEDEIPEWIQYKITMASDYISTAEQYLSYNIHRYESGDPLPAYESKLLRATRLLEAEEEQTTVGAVAKGGAAVERAQKIFDKIPGLEAVLKAIDTKDELTALIQAIVTGAIETGGLKQAEVNAALTNATAAAKKG
jgi:hypothetical protein